MRRDEIEGRGWKKEVLEKGYFICRSLLDSGELDVVRDRIHFIAAHAETYQKLGIGHVKEDEPSATNPLHRYYRLNSSRIKDRAISSRRWIPETLDVIRKKTACIARWNPAIFWSGTRMPCITAGPIVPINSALALQERLLQSAIHPG